MPTKTSVSLLIVGLTLFVGCTTTRTSDTSRTGIEQLLISNAVDQTLNKTTLPPLRGRSVFLEEKYLDSVDKGYIVGTLRQKLLAGGAKLVDKKEDSEVTVELCSGGVGTDNVQSFVGVPGMALPGPVPIEIPEIRLWEKSSQYGTAKLGVVAYATETGEPLHDSGTALARADDSSWSVMGLGPFQSGTVRDEVLLNTSGTDFTSRVANSANSLTNFR